MEESKEICVIDIDKLKEHPANPNVMDANVFNKLVRHIEFSGNYEPVVVRCHPEDEGCYQMLNGHHRVKALKKIGYKKVDCVVWEVDDEQALVLLATLNRLGGKDDLFKKSELVKSLAKSMDVKRIVRALPETKRSVERLKSLDTFKPVVSEEQEERLSPMVFFVNQSQRECIDGAIAKAIEECVSDDCMNKRTAGLMALIAEDSFGV